MSLQEAENHTAERSGQVAALYKSLLSVQKEMPPLMRNNEARIKTKGGGEYGYKYASLSDTLNTVRPVLNKHGLLLLQYQEASAIDSGNTTMLITELTHVESGEYLRQYTMVFVLPTDPQQSGANMTYARRYAIQVMLGLATEDPDADIEAMARQELIKTRDTYVPLIGSAIKNDDPLDAKRVIDALSEWQYQVVWKELTTKQKSILREWRTSGRMKEEPINEHT